MFVSVLGTTSIFYLARFCNLITFYLSAFVVCSSTNSSDMLLAVRKILVPANGNRHQTVNSIPHVFSTAYRKAHLLDDCMVLKRNLNSNVNLVHG